MGKGPDIDPDTKIKIYDLRSRGSVLRDFKKTWDYLQNTKWWIERHEQIPKSGDLSSKRKGIVGRKKIYSPRSAEKLVRRLGRKGMT